MEFFHHHWSKYDSPQHIWCAGNVVQRHYDDFSIRLLLLIQKITINFQNIFISDSCQFECYGQSSSVQLPRDFAIRTSFCRMPIRSTSFGSQFECSAACVSIHICYYFNLHISYSRHCLTHLSANLKNRTIFGPSEEGVAFLSFLNVLSFHKKIINYFESPKNFCQNFQHVEQSNFFQRFSPSRRSVKKCKPKFTVTAPASCCDSAPRS